eukprot:2979892-Prymnesium_polylepis.2
MQHSSHAARARAGCRVARAARVHRASGRAGAPDGPRGAQDRRVPVLQRRPVGDHLPALHRRRAGDLDAPHGAARRERADGQQDQARAGHRARLDRWPRAPVGQLELHLGRVRMFAPVRPLDRLGLPRAVSSAQA